MDIYNLKKEYHHNDLTIVWQSGKCIHSGNCVKNNPKVFKPNQQPWIQADAADADSIMQTIDKCPSGALSYYKNK